VNFLGTCNDVCQENRLAQLATFDQQREMTRYLTALNQWLARDVEDRHNEMRSVMGRIDDLRNEMRRRGGSSFFGVLYFELILQQVSQKPPTIASPLL
jgi:hypothetical protein